MGWASASGIFDTIAQALIDSGADDTTKTSALATVIKTFRDEGWDTADESLDQFRHDPAIVEAFRRNGVVITCDAYDDERHLGCELETGHDGYHRCWNGQTWTLDDKPPVHVDVLQLAKADVPDVLQWQIHCPRCAAPEIEGGRRGDVVHPDDDVAVSPLGTRGGHVSADMECGAGHEFQLVVANHKGAAYVGILF